MAFKGKPFKGFKVFPLRSAAGGSRELFEEREGESFDRLPQKLGIYKTVTVIYKTVTSIYKTVAATYKTVTATYKTVTVTCKTVTVINEHGGRDSRELFEKGEGEPADRFPQKLGTYKTVTSRFGTYKTVTVIYKTVTVRYKTVTARFGIYKTVAVRYRTVTAI